MTHCPICGANDHDPVPVPALTRRHAPSVGATAHACPATGSIRWRVGDRYLTTRAASAPRAHAAGDGWAVSADGGTVGVLLGGVFVTLNRDAAAALGRHLVAAFAGES